jgi:hypothetical protein
MELRTKSWHLSDLLRVANKDETLLEGMQASESVARSSDKTLLRRAPRRWEQVTGCAGENMSDENEILLIGVPWEVCENCGA